MLIDGAELAGGGTVRADVCVVGAGPAGLTVALALAARAASVLVLEAGAPGLAPTGEAGRADSELHPADHLAAAFGRGVGGTAHLWEVDVGDGRPHVRHAWPDELDFRRRPPLHDAAWPFGLEALAAHRERAAVECGLAGPEFARPPGENPLALPEADLVTKLFAFGPAAAFTGDARDRLARSESATVATGATALALEQDGAGRRVSAVVVHAGGRTLRVESGLVVLAAGPLENARLLLEAPGAWNEHDLVGRYAMDHPFLEVGLLEPADRSVFDRSALYDLRPAGGRPVMGYLSPSPAALERERLLNAALFLFPRPPAYGSSAVRAIRELRLRRGADVATARRAARALLGAPDVLSWLLQRRLSAGIAPEGDAGGWSALEQPSRRFGVFRVDAQIEQAPHADNRVTLGGARDALGRRLVDLHWRWRDVDVGSFERLQAFLSRTFAASGAGRFRPTGSIATAFSPHHTMGTTRMHEDPGRGVVDADCCVHGTENLFVAGTSVFPNAAGSANPTLLVVALALRLGDHLLARL